MNAACAPSTTMSEALNNYATEASTKKMLKYHIYWHQIPQCILYLFVCFDSLRPSQQFFSYGLTSTKQGLMCLAQGHNTVMLVRLEPATPRSRVKHSTT